MAAGGAAGATIPGELIGAEGLGDPRPLPSSVSPYLECGANRMEANVCDWLDVNCADNSAQYFIPGSCENGHRVGKRIVCGKEWCPRCGAKKSIAHNRRYVRWLSKIQQFKRMRYLVFTIPEDIRDQYRTKKSLRSLGREVQELLKAQGFTRGLRRWHWFGDKSHKWHPHLNVLVEGGYMNGATLQAIKTGYAAILGVDTVSVKARYKPRPGDMAGCLYYVTRATFLDYEWDMDMALELMNFRNMVVWGRDWKQAPSWSLNEVTRVDVETGEEINVEAIEKIVSHTCHVCGETFTWESHALPVRLLDLTDTEDLGAGYVRIIDRSPPSLEGTFMTRLIYSQGQHGYLGQHGYDLERLRARKAELLAKRQAEWDKRKAEALSRGANAL